MYFKVGKIFFVNNKKKSSKMLLNIILRKLPSPHGKFSVMILVETSNIYMGQAKMTKKGFFNR